MKKKLIAMLAITVTSAIMLAGCATQAPTQPQEPAATPEAASQEQAPPEPEEDEPEAAAENQWFGETIVMGTNAEFPPFEFIADGGQGAFGQFDGVDVVIGMRIAEHLGAELYIEDLPFEGLIMGLAAGQFDFVAAALTVTEERAQSVDFSIPYYDAYQTILVVVDNDDINQATDLTGMLVGVQLGTTGDFAADDLDAEVMRYNRAVEALIPLMNGQIDAILVDSITAEFFYSAHPGALRLVRDNEFFGNEQYAIAVGQGRPELLAAINEVLEEMIENGEIAELVRYYAQY